MIITKRAQRDVARAPKRIAESLQDWVCAIELEGLAVVRRIPGYHDEPLRGRRSVRLNRQWRAIYCELCDDELTIVCIEEVTPHGY